MRKIIYFFAFLLTFTCYAQTFHEYFVVEKENASIEPVSKVINNDGTLSLTFEHQDINDFFNNGGGGAIVNKYEKAFPGAVSPLLQRTYIVSLNGDQYLSDLEILSDVEFAEFIEEPSLLFEPNDPYYVDGGVGFTYLELVRANKAWDITTGDSKVYIGISDNPFDIYHEDLIDKFVYADNIATDQSHGTWVAGFISPNTNNNKGISGIGYNTKMVGSSMGTISAYNLAKVPGVRVINLSWKGRCHTPGRVDNAIYYEIRNILDVLVVAAAGNGKTCGGPNHYVYPASYESVLSVSSIGHIYPIGDSNMFNQKDVHQRYIDLGNPDEDTNQHNDKVDIVAPGSDLRTTGFGSNYKFIYNGTSTSAPQVAAAAGLIYSINPYLSADEVEDILKRTADDIYWIPENAPYIGKLGTGRLNVFRAVKETECMDDSNPIVDLVVRDSKEDIGIEPNEQTTGAFWKSDDVWIRNQPDGKYYYESDEVINYDPNIPSYAYVKITNYGCQTSSGNDELVLSWSASTISHPFPENGSTFTNGFVGTQTIPSLSPGQEVILEFEWYPPNPNNFPPVFGTTDGLNVSLLARIISDDDPITYPSSLNIIDFVKNNNNVAWKNISLVNISPVAPIQAAKFYVYNPTDQVKTYNIELNETVGSANKSLYEEAEVYLEMDTNIYDSWSSGGSMADNLNATKSNEKKLISGEYSALENITLQPGEIGGIEISFNFLIKELTGTELYEYDIVQKEASSGEIIGGTSILIDKYNRNPFAADAQKEEENNQVRLTAEDIGEPAVYNWYDSEGNLISSGSELTVSPEFAKTYNLEIISNLDGFKDYKEVSIEGSIPYSLNSLSPNPAGKQVQVNYDISAASSAYLKVTNIATNSSNNYILDLNTSQESIDLSNYSSGVYLVTLICDGVVVDSKNLLKN